MPMPRAAWENLSYAASASGDRWMCWGECQLAGFRNSAPREKLSAGSFSAKKKWRHRPSFPSWSLLAKNNPRLLKIVLSNSWLSLVNSLQTHVKIYWLIKLFPAFQTQRYWEEKKSAGQTTVFTGWKPLGKAHVKNRIGHKGIHFKVT